MNSGSGLEWALISFIIVVVIAVALFLLFRAIVLWYWRIDRIIELLEQIAQGTRGSLPTKQDRSVGQSKCPRCGAPLDPGVKFCPKCKCPFQ
jgi:hypothetical protein